MFISKQIATLWMTICVASTAGVGINMHSGEEPSSVNIATDGEVASSKKEIAVAERKAVPVEVKEIVKAAELLAPSKKDIAVAKVVEAVKEKEQAMITDVKEKPENKQEAIKVAAVEVQQIVKSAETSSNAEKAPLETKEAKLDEKPVEQKLQEDLAAAASASQQMGAQADEDMLKATTISSSAHAGSAIREYSPVGKESSIEKKKWSYDDLADRYRVKTSPITVATRVTVHTVDGSSFALEDGPQLSEDMQRQRNIVCILVGSIIVFTVWFTQGRQGTSRWNIDSVLNAELKGVEIPGVGNPVEKRKRLSSNTKDCAEPDLL